MTIKPEVLAALGVMDSAVDIAESNHTVFTADKRRWQTIRAELLAMDAILTEALKDAARYVWVVNEPEGAMHLLNLLKNKRGNSTDFGNMIDRIRASKDAILDAPCNKWYNPHMKEPPAAKGKGLFSLLDEVSSCPSPKHKARAGKIVKIIPYGTYPANILGKDLRGIRYRGWWRNHESYIVEDASGKWWWPRVCHLTLIKRGK